MKRSKKGIIATLGIIVGIFILNIIISTTTGVNVLSNTVNYVQKKLAPNKEEVKSIELPSDDYEANKGGSYKINKSAEWTGTDTAQINFNVDTIQKNDDIKKDVIFVLDISKSMEGDKLNRVKNDTKDLIKFLLTDKDNRVALITFNTISKIEYGLTDNKEELLSKIDSLTASRRTNYYQALIDVDKVLNDYKKQENREAIILFLTDGYPCEDTPNEVMQYKLLKEKYPYITINGIQYEMSKYIIDDIRRISDKQFIANMDNLNNILFAASKASEPYEKFELVDYIANEYFYVKSVSDIKVSIGKVTLTEENGTQKVTWTVSPEEFITGRSQKMTINLKLKEQYVGSEGYYPTNQKFEITSKLPNEKEVKQATYKTPILKSGYKVYYDTNTPTDCKLDNFEETHYSFENVKIADELSCEGYQFKGWTIIDEVNNVNGDYFIMPSNDVTIKATWSKQDITKSMDGTVYAEPTSIMKQYTYSSTDDYHDSKYRSKVTKIVVKDNISVPDTAIERWDVSQEGNNSVIAYIEDDGTGNGTYKVTIGGYGKVIANEDSSYLFYNFSNLQDIDLSNFDTSQVTNMSSMFASCSQLTSLDLSGFDTSKVTNMNGMFSSCSKLTSLDLSNFDTSNVTSMASMFYYCYDITSIDISNFDTSNVTNMFNMFKYCRNLTNLDLSNFDTSKVTNMTEMFYECRSLTSLDLSSFDTSNITKMDYMFKNCISLTSLDLSSFDTSNVTSMFNMFNGCSKLTTLDLSSFDTSNVTNMQAMFSGCSNLTSLGVSDFNISNASSISYMFSDCRNLTTTINIKSNPASYVNIFSGAATSDGTQITVNYTSKNSSLVDYIIREKSNSSHVSKGQLITD